MKADHSDLWLIAEDCDDHFLLLKRACARLRPTPRLYRAKNGVQAKCYLAGEGEFGDRRLHPLPELILSDVKMPLMDGFELLAWAKADPGVSRIPFIILTSSVIHQDRDRANALGSNEYLVKPFDSVGFVEMLQAVMRRDWTGRTERMLSESHLCTRWLDILSAGSPVAALGSRGGAWL